MKTLLAFHNSKTLKEKYLARVRAHKLADEIIRGAYWESGKGCAVGCTVHSAMHSDYESELGIPRVLAKLEDMIFEGLSNGEAKEFPEMFLESINVGADLSSIKAKFFIWLLADPIDGVARYASGLNKKIILNVAVLYEKGGTPEEFRKAAASATGDAWIATAAAWASAAAAAAYSDGKKKSFGKQKAKLLELLKAAN